jgi:hypothetical protein
MRPSWRSELLGAAVLPLALLAAATSPIRALGADAVKVKYPLHFTGFWKNESGFVEGGPGWERSVTRAASLTQTLKASLQARLPYGDKEKKLAVIDRDSDTLKLIASVGWERDSTPEAGTSSTTWSASARAEWGTARYEYNPGGGAEEARRRDSWGAELNGLAYFKEGARRLGPQLRLRYGREWKAAPEVGVVIPGSGGAPDTVKALVLAPPTVTTEASARLGLPFYLPAADAIAFGPYLSWRIGGGDDFTPGAYQRVRGELWVYYFPASATPSARVGLAGFFDWRAAGADGLPLRDGGLLVQLRFGAKLIEY